MEGQNKTLPAGKGINNTNNHEARTEWKVSADKDTKKTVMRDPLGCLQCGNWTRCAGFHQFWLCYHGRKWDYELDW